MKRNVGKHTNVAAIEANILAALKGADTPMYASTLGYAAFPDYNFKMPQGAAFAVARVASNMEKRGLIRWRYTEFARGWVLA